MTTKTLRQLRLASAAAWLVIAGYGARSILVDNGDGWALPYNIFFLALMAGAALTILLLTSLTRSSARPWLRGVGLGVSVLGGVLSFVAWALPLWMTVLGVGFAILAVASEPPARRLVAVLAVGQLAGVALLFAGLALQFGRRDEYGDHPVAGGIALVVTGLAMAFGLGSRFGDAGRTIDRSERPFRSPAPARTS